MIGINELKTKAKEINQTIRYNWAICASPQKQKMIDAKTKEEKDILNIGVLLNGEMFEQFKIIENTITALPILPWEQWKLRKYFHDIYLIYRDLSLINPTSNMIPDTYDIRLKRNINKIGIFSDKTISTVILAGMIAIITTVLITNLTCDNKGSIPKTTKNTCYNNDDLLRR